MSVETIAARLVAAATARGVRIATAESLTGGLLAAAIVGVPGASAVFTGGIVAYDTELKRTILGVDPDLLRERGPVDPEVARQMARGVRKACAVRGEVEVGIATTGVAGPDPDPQTGQLPGTVWVGVSSVAGDRAVRVAVSPGTREEVRQRSVDAALKALQEEILKT